MCASPGGHDENAPDARCRRALARCCILFVRRIVTEGGDRPLPGCVSGGLPSRLEPVRRSPPHSDRWFSPLTGSCGQREYFTRHRFERNAMSGVLDCISGQGFVNGSAMSQRSRFKGPAMSFGNMRSLGIGRLSLACFDCKHEAMMDAALYPDDLAIVALRARFVCSVCKGRNFDCRPDWLQYRAAGMARRNCENPAS